MPNVLINSIPNSGRKTALEIFSQANFDIVDFPVLGAPTNKTFFMITIILYDFKIFNNLIKLPLLEIVWFSGRCGMLHIYYIEK